MSFPRYPEYQNSAVEWLGDVPAHWSIKPLKYVATHNDEVLPESTPKNRPLNYIEISDVDEQRGITRWSEHTFATAPSRARRVLRGGDVLISTVRTYLRAIAPVPKQFENFIGSTGFASIRPVHGRYHSALLGYTLRAEWFISSVIARSVGISYPAINASDLVALKVPIPPWKEQKSIATFLDHETARIDALIEEQKRLIELLKEKRQAVISHAVTKGLDPEVPTKDSGVEWLGEVPVHWDIFPIWMTFELGRGRVISHSEMLDNNGRYPVYSSQTESDGVMGNIDSYDFDGDYLTWTTDGANAGTVFRRSGKFNCTNVCGTLKPSRNDVNLDYLWSAVSISTKAFIRHDINLKLMNGVMASIRIRIPPAHEQKQIAHHLSHSLSQMEPLAQEAERLIACLQERRSALISAAVTGKIDVRNWQSPAQADAEPHAMAAEPNAVYGEYSS